MYLATFIVDLSSLDVKSLIIGALAGAAVVAIFNVVCLPNRPRRVARRKY